MGPNNPHPALIGPGHSISLLLCRNGIASTQGLLGWQLERGRVPAPSKVKDRFLIVFQGQTCLQGFIPM